MSALAQDCFAYGGDRIAVAAAQELLRKRIAPVVGIEEVALDAAAGRCLAAPLVCERDVPAFDNAAVDGFAFAFSPAIGARGRYLALARASRGRPPVPATYRPAPRCACSPARHAPRHRYGGLQEECDGGRQRRVPPASRRARTGGGRARMSRAGSRPSAGHRLRPQDIGLAAELGGPPPRPRAAAVALLSTGDELLETGAGFARGASTTPTAPSSGRSCRRCRPRSRTSASRPTIRPTVGERRRGRQPPCGPHLRRCVARRRGPRRPRRPSAGRLDFWQIAMKPGRPLAFGRLGDAVFVGLPGNPVATMVCFLLFARPVLLRLAGSAWRTPTGLPVRRICDCGSGRAQRVSACRLSAPTRTAGLIAHRIGREGSGILTSMVEAQGLVEIGAEIEGVAPGEPCRS